MLINHFQHLERHEGAPFGPGLVLRGARDRLAPILMTVSFLKEKENDETTAGMIQTLETCARRGAYIVRQVLTFARGVEGEQTAIQLKHLLTSMERMLQQTLPKSIEIHTDIPRDLLTVSADATQLHQVFMNLCVNSRDAMPNGGFLTISAENLTIDEYYAAMYPEAQPGAYVAIGVSDTGTGIPQDLRDKIFRLYFSTKSDGSGIGLAMTFRIVQLHDGTIDFKSEPDKGTTFLIRLPIAA